MAEGAVELTSAGPTSLHPTTALHWVGNQAEVSSQAGQENHPRSCKAPRQPFFIRLGVGEGGWLTRECLQ